MRILCTSCGKKAIIGKTDRLSVGHANLYCSCSDPECGHTFVTNLSFSHTLSPSAKTTSEIVSALVKALPPEQRKALQRELAF
ncbi:transcriptional regulator [Shewanella xiamenensis]|uniref:ogr/Delta-like zinc finger family protein n=1 Tax=Shewanella xiamenensis TaxID=332186 RepID=UPI001C4FE5C6|nr:ogr/Delta-like zinc finger family protein [Shewanella xiamenensis]MBW0280698.1 transcriptional regulator [Shewanella xiamenensis]